ncbi:MAG: NAD(P)/FAD-dependent oxidoreductase [Candidatus Njordarchaeum guaymaensis]
MPRTERVAVIGAGITGACISRVLSMYENLEVHLIEKEVDVGWGSTKANTAIIHAGYDDDPDKYPVRASLCAKGNAIWREKWMDELDIRANWPGDLVVAVTEDDVKTLKKLLERGIRNGVPGIRIIWDKKEIEELEPNITPNVIAALYAPTEGQVWHPASATIAVVENAVDNGVKLHLGTEVTGIRVRHGRVAVVETNKGEIEVDWVINAAGLFADVISSMVGITHFKIHPRRGEYYLFSRDAYPKTKRILFPAPLPWTKGVVVTTTVDGNLMLGPNAQDLPKEESDARNTTLEGLDYVWREAHKVVKALPPKSKVIRTFAGLRVEPEPVADFIIRAYDEVEGFINAAGIRSPGFASAPAIAYKIVEIMKERGAELVKKKKWNPYRKEIRRFHDASWEERDRLIQENPLYAKIVCQCELVTEAEIVEAIKRGATTLDGIKFRTRAMTGDCQGSFCMFKIAQILARELKIPVWKVTKTGPGSEIGFGDVTVFVKEEKKEEAA